MHDHARAKQGKREQESVTSPEVIRSRRSPNGVVSTARSTVTANRETVLGDRGVNGEGRGSGKTLGNAPGHAPRDGQPDAYPPRALPIGRS